jgi:hypothetical protein
LVSLVVGAIGAGIGWALTEFVARPIRKFFDLRGEIIRRIAQYNVPVRYRETQEGHREDLLSREGPASQRRDEAARVNEAQSVLRDLASQMRGFSYNETWATRVLLVRYYKPGRASDGLFGLSNDLETDGRARWKKIISDALRIPEHTL